MNNKYSNKRGIKYYILLALVIFISSYIVSWFQLSNLIGFLTIFIPCVIFDIIWINYHFKL